MFFYADDRVVASTNQGWLQTVIDTLTGLFDRVGLKANIKKTVGVVCRPFWVAVIQADKSYTRGIIGVGRIYKERQQERVQCPEFGKDLVRGSLAAHRQNQHGV